MNKEQIRSLLGQLISLQAMIREMEEKGFSWDTMSEIKQDLNIIIIDLEKALDWPGSKSNEKRAFIYLYKLHTHTHEYTIWINTIFSLGSGFRGHSLGPYPIRERWGPMKHANDIFPQALSELIALGEKQRRFIEEKEKAVDHSDRETVSQIRVKRKEKRAHVRLTEREKVQLTFNL